MAEDDADDQPSTAEVTEVGDLLGQAVEGDIEAQEFVSTMVERVAVADAMGQSWGNLDQRDYFDTLGYPSQSQLDIDDYWAMFKRGGIAETIITAISGATWSDAPEVTDHDGEDDDAVTDFEDDVESLFDDTGALWALERVDTLQRIGRFGVLYIGFDDGFDEMSEPVDASALAGDPSEDILYYQPFSEKQIQDFEREQDPNDERFGKPKTYDLDFGDEGLGVETVHHSRVLHVAEGALEDEVVGYSAYRPVFNHLVDLLYKVMGGSSEMYWRSADRKIIANQPEAGQLPDEDKVVKQIEELVHNLRNVAWTSNVEVDSIGGDTPDPEGLKDGLIELIAGNLRVPKRKLLGTERGDLASTQDEAAFVQSIEERRQKFAEPRMFRDFIGLLLGHGVLADPRDDSYDVDWPDNFELTELEEAELQQRKAKAYKDVSAMGDPSEVATLEERRVEVLDLPPERGEAVEATPPPEKDDDVEDDTDVEDTGVDDVGDVDLDEDDPEVDDWFDEHFEADRAAADGGSVLDLLAAYDAGDHVLTGAGPGVIASVETSDFEFPTDAGEGDENIAEVSASGENPAYVVMLGGKSGVYRESALTKLGDDDADPSVLREQKGNTTSGSALYTISQVDFEESVWPEGWDVYSALSFYADVSGGDFEDFVEKIDDTEAFSVDDARAFAADAKDQLAGTERWRSRW